MTIRAAAFYVALALTLGPASAHAQGRPSGAPGAPLEALLNEINALKARVTTLEASQAALGARVTALETIDESDIIGTYALQTLGVELNSGFPARVNSETASGMVTLNADGTGTTTVTDGRCTLAESNPWFVDCTERSGQESFTWSLANGVLTVVDPEDGPQTFPVTPTGVIIFGGTSEFLDGHGWSNIGIFVKVANQ